MCTICNSLINCKKLRWYKRNKTVQDVLQFSSRKMEARSPEASINLTHRNWQENVSKTCLKNPRKSHKYHRNPSANTSSKFSSGTYCLSSLMDLFMASLTRSAYAPPISSTSHALVFFFPPAFTFASLSVSVLVYGYGFALFHFICLNLTICT